MPGPTLYFVAGEPSGDNHGAALLRALRQRAPASQILGRGGPKMRALAGTNFRDWMAKAAVVGLGEVLKLYRYFRAELSGAIEEVAAAQPNAVVLIDYPGFNLRLARALRRRLPRLTIVYYVSPQVWAWHRRRIPAMARYLDLMLCIFPFEPELYRASGLRALFVGHPMVIAGRGNSATLGRSGAEPDGHESAPAAKRREDDQRDDTLIALFPGSREREVRKIFPVMRDAALQLLRQRPELHFEIGAASTTLAALVHESLGGGSLPSTTSPDVFRVSTGQAAVLMRRARAGMVASGTATLEAALARLPFVLIYRVNWLTYFAARLVVKVKHLGMPNVLAGREIVPEFIQHRARPAAIAARVAKLLPDNAPRRDMLRNFEQIASTLGAGEAAENAAEAILAEIGFSA